MAVADSPLHLFVRKLDGHVALSADDRRAITALPWKARMLEPSSYLVREGDTPETCSVIGSGFAYRQKITGNGDRQIVSLHIPGEAVDLQHLFLDKTDHSVQMLTRGEVAFVQRGHLQELARMRPAVGRAMTICMLVEASISREWILNVGRRDARTRVAHLLCEFAIRLDAQGLATDYGYHLPVTQEQLADAVGLTPVHVNRTLKALAAAGLITRSKRNVSFPDWDRMREAGDFEPRYLHLDRQRAGNDEVSL